jgi:hypothetical protein
MGITALYTVPRGALLDYHARPVSEPEPDPDSMDTVPLNPDPPESPLPAAVDALRPPAPARRPMRPPTRLERLEAWASRLSIKNNFFHKIFSLVWLPYAARSGIKMYGKKALSAERFAAILPFRRFNRNFYDAMAGAALLGNSEVAAGMYLVSICGGDYTVVCKEMKYRFLRPCLGPAVYRVVKSQDVEEKVAAGGEFNVSLEMEIYQQQLVRKDSEILVGRCDITFHCTPKSMVRDREERRRAVREKRKALDSATPGSSEGAPGR